MLLKKINLAIYTNKLFSFVFYSEICWFYFFLHILMSQELKQ